MFGCVELASIYGSGQISTFNGVRVSPKASYVLARMSEMDSADYMEDGGGGASKLYSKRNDWLCSSPPADLRDLGSWACFGTSGKHFERESTSSI